MRYSGGKRRALVIGNANYRSATKLANPVNDAIAMTEALERLRFQVKLARDCDINDFDDRLREFSESLEDKDTALFYYSGHAIQFGGENYLVPVDARLSRPSDLQMRAFSLNSQLDKMRRAAAVSIVFLDACRDDPFQLGQAELGQKNVVVTKRGLADLSKAELRDAIIAFAAENGQTASEGSPGGLSPFTEGLLTYIEQADLEVIKMLQQVRQHVRKETGNAQIPWSNESLTKEFFFNATTIETAKTPDVADPIPERRKSKTPTTGPDISPISEPQPAVSEPFGEVYGSVDAVRMTWKNFARVFPYIFVISALPFFTYLGGVGTTSNQLATVSLSAVVTAATFLLLSGSSEASTLRDALAVGAIFALGSWPVAAATEILIGVFGLMSDIKLYAGWAEMRVIGGVAAITAYLRWRNLLPEPVRRIGLLEIASLFAASAFYIFVRYIVFNATFSLGSSSSIQYLLFAFFASPVILICWALLIKHTKARPLSWLIAAILLPQIVCVLAMFGDGYLNQPLNKVFDTLFGGMNLFTIALWLFIVPTAWSLSAIPVVRPLQQTLT